MSTLKQQLLHAQQTFSDTKIPVMPKEVIELQNLFAKDDYPDMNRLEAIIIENTALSGEVIKIANQPQFLNPRLTKVNTIRDALMVIGLKRLKNLVVSVSYQMQTQSMGFAEVSDFSLYVAKLASVISNCNAEVAEDEAYLAGLFHNAGALLLAAKFPDYDKVFMMSLKYAYRGTQLEDKHYGTTHTVAGLLVAKNWALSQLFNQVILLHHQQNLQTINDTKARALVAIVQVAIAVVTQELFEDYATAEVGQMLKNACDELMISEDCLVDIRSTLNGQVDGHLADD